MFLLIPNRKLPLRFLIAIRKILEILHGHILRDCHTKLDVAFRVFVTRLPKLQ